MAAQPLVAGTSLSGIVTVGQGIFGPGGGVGYSGDVTDPYGSVTGPLTFINNPSIFIGLVLAYRSYIFDPTTSDFEVWLRGASLPQGYFFGVLVRDDGGNWRSFRTSDATYFTGGSGTLWIWDTVANPVWAPAAVGSPRSLIIQLN